MSEQSKDYIRYWPFYKAVQENDWKGVEDFISKLNPKELTANIKVYREETIFHVLNLNLDVPIWLMEKLASKVEPKALEEMTNENRRSTIFHASLFGNINSTKAFVRRNKDLPNNRDKEGFLPIHLAAQRGHKEVVQYLLSVTKVPLDEKHGVKLLEYLINSSLHGIALDLLKRYPKLAREENKDRSRILSVLANKPKVFESGSQLGHWKRVIYKLIRVKEEKNPAPKGVDGDVENLVAERSKNSAKFTHLGFLQQLSTAFDALCQNLHTMLWNVLMQIGIKCIHDTKLTNIQALEIVKIMCHDGVIWSNEEAAAHLRLPVLTAATLGIYELVNEIMKAYFYAFTFLTNDVKNDIFGIAILHRHEKVFRLVNKKNILLSWKPDVMYVPDLTKKTDNILHLAGKLVPSSQIPGAALQMQRELQWFKAVSSCVHPSFQEQQNESNKTPREVFTENHANLVEKGEKWMKETAQSCSVVAALIITVVFAAAFTVPGGNDCTEGTPVFLHKPSFIVFVISDALALFSSTASVLTFLGMLTSRYSEEDFLESLPKELIIGFITLFLSIASMTVAFGATLYIFLSHSWSWTIIPISLLGCFPVILFAKSQFPLLVEIFSYTCGHSIFQPTKDVIILQKS